jgi:hypothetical protein
MLGKLRFLITAAVLPLAFAQTPNYTRDGEVKSGSFVLTGFAPGKALTVLYSLNPADLTADSRVTVSVKDGDRVLASKTLHAGDPDLYTVVRPAQAAVVTVEAAQAKGRFQLRARAATFAAPGHTWETAASIELGQVTAASGDETEYVPLPGRSRKEIVQAPAGEQWYRFEFAGGAPKLVFFQIELMDRDDVPVDASVFRLVNGKPEEFTEGQDPVAQPHEVQALPGNKFAPRVLRDAGTYYVRVRANHPEYKLRTRVYDAPPYRNPQDAVRTAVDYIMGAGDSWFANTPRRGGAFDRVSGVHQETSLCVACHASHFSQRAQLYSIANGYPLVQRQQLHFLEERFYNNPRPFYGFEREGAVWSRVISAPANVLSRMDVLTGLYEQNVSGVPRPRYHAGIAEYLKIYYAGKDKLPPDETNGNTPLVSAHEVAWYSWKATKDPRLPEMIAGGEVKNMVDLCYQTLALAEIDRTKYADKIKANAERILSLQRESGQWSMRFEPAQPEVEFQTGHALWALSAAGIPATEPRVKKALDYLLSRQQAFGGWMDPTQSFENFKTPFRETQFAVLALSSYFPRVGRAKGWDAPLPKSLSADPATLVAQLDGVWERPAPALMKQIESAAASDEPMVRQAALEVLGRLAMPGSVPLLVKSLGDGSKLVQRTAAWALRQVYGASPGAPHAELAAALASSEARLRWGAARVFAHQFAALAKEPDLVESLRRLAADPVPAIRMAAVKALWQDWFWNGDAKTRSGIEDTLLSAMAAPQHPWVMSNLEGAIYNLADENIRYLYNNWVALLGRPEDRDRAMQGRLAVESQLAEKFAKILAQGPDAQKKHLLAALADFPLRRGDIYDLSPTAGKKESIVVSRLGNDIEQVAFFGTSAAALSSALMPLMDSPDAELRGLARRASLIVRETTFDAVEKAAGGRSETTVELSRKLDAAPDAAEVAKRFHLPPPRSAGPRPQTVAAPVNATPLDEPFFRANVEPILTRKGPDGYACVNCHANHTLFDATWSTVKNVVDRRDPENSLLLRKPTSTAESEGVANARATAHGGGLRWTRGSSEYETILKWIQGAR